MSFFGVELNSQVNRLVLEIRLKLSQNKLNPNFRTIYRSFATYDKNATGLISPIHFEKALNQNGFFFKKFEVQAFQKAFLNQVGLVNWHAFLNHLKQPMGPNRRQLVEDVFDQLSGGKNQVSVEKLKSSFNNEGYDMFKKVIKNQEIPFESFSNVVAIKDGNISRQQFVAFHDDLSVNFPQDDIFQKFVLHQWSCKQRTKQKINQQQLKSAIKALRFKLIQKTNGTKDEFLFRKLFNQFDRNKNQSIGGYELDLMLKKLQLPLSPKLITPLLDQLDKNKSGYIQYDQFKKFIFFDSFPK